MDDRSRVPVKFPGWSQPGVSALQARLLLMKMAKKVMRVMCIVVIISVCYLLFLSNSCE